MDAGAAVSSWGGWLSAYAFSTENWSRSPTRCSEARWLLQLGAIRQPPRRDERWAWVRWWPGAGLGWWRSAHPASLAVRELTEDNTVMDADDVRQPRWALESLDGGGESPDGVRGEIGDPERITEHRSQNISPMSPTCRMSTCSCGRP